MNSEYPNMRGYFSISSFDVSPDEVTKMLGIRPDDSASKGELRKRQGGLSDYQVTSSFWMLHSSVHNSFNIDDYIIDLIMRIKPISIELKKSLKLIGKCAECNIFIVIGIIPGSPLPSLILKPDEMFFLSDNSISLVFDMN